MPNSSSLAGLKVAEKFVVVVGWVGGGGEHVATVSNSNAFAELRWVLTICKFLFSHQLSLDKEVKEMELNDEMFVT